MAKAITFSIRAKPVRNGHVAAMFFRAGTGAHGKTSKAERRNQKVQLKRIAEVSQDEHQAFVESLCGK